MRAGAIGWALTLACCGMLAACGRAPAKEDRIVAEAKAHAKAWSGRQATRDEAKRAAAIAAVEAAPDCPPGRFRFVPDDRLSMFELGNLGEELQGEWKSSRLIFLPFDYDLHPPRGEWGAAGVIYVRGDPPDRRTIGGVLWARPADFLSDGGGAIVKGPAGDVLTVSLVPDYADPEGTKIICIARFRATLAPDGTLTAGGKKVGVFH